MQMQSLAAMQVTRLHCLHLPILKWMELHILFEIVLFRLSYVSDSQDSWRSIKSCKTYDKPKG